MACRIGSDPDAAWSFPSRKGRVFGYKVHVLLDRDARLSIVFLLSPANRNDLPFAYPLLGLARCLLGPPLRIVHADGAYWGLALARFIVALLRARDHPLQSQEATARAVIERFFGIANRHYGLDATDAIGWEPILLRVTLTFCVILVVALGAHQAGVPQLRLSPTRVLAHYLPFRRSPELRSSLQPARRDLVT